MSSRVSYFLAVLLLLVGAVLRLYNISSLPPGLSDDEIIDIRIAETAREGVIEVFYPLGDEGREGLYHIASVIVTSFIGNGPLGYRIFSVWIGLLTVALTYAIGRRLFGQLAGLSAMGLMAVTFWPVLLSRQITREMLIPLLITYILYCLATVLPVYRIRRRRMDNTSAAAALGALLGMILYLHPIGILTLLIGMIFIAYMLITRQSMSRRRLSYIGFSLLLMIILSIPYLISTIRLPALSGVDRLTGSNYPWVSLQAILDSVGGIAISGDTNPLHNIPGNALVDPVTGILIVVGLIVAIRARRHPRYVLLLITSVILSPVFLFAANSPDFINYTPILPLVALYFGVGLQQISVLIPRFGYQVAFVIFACIVIVQAQWTVNNLFQKWVDLPEVQQAYNGELGYLARYIDRNADDKSLIVCGWSFEQRPTAPILNDAQTIDIMLNDKSAPVRWVDCNNAMVMTNGGAYQEVIIPSPESVATIHQEIQSWLEYSEPIYNGTIFALDVESELADRIGLFTVETPVQYAPELGEERETLVNTPITFGGNLTFLGYVAENTTFQAGDVVPVVTYWRVDGLVPSDLRLFTHILADPGASPPANRDIINLIPAQLRNRDVFANVTYVPLPESLPVGEYFVSIGAYQDTSDERLPVLENGETRGTRLFLYTITIEE